MGVVGLQNAPHGRGLAVPAGQIVCRIQRRTQNAVSVPLRLYLVISALFFLVLGQKQLSPVHVDTNSRDKAQMNGTIHIGGQTIDMATLPRTVPEFDKQQRVTPLPFPLRTIARQVVKARADGKTFAQSLITQFLDDAPKAMFALLPAFALLLALTYRRQRRYYVEHLIFALHAHAFTFLVLTGVALWPAFDGNGPGPVVVMGALAVYLLVALRRVYGQGWGKTFAKFCWLAWNYLFLLTFTLLLALGAAFLFA